VIPYIWRVYMDEKPSEGISIICIRDRGASGYEVKIAIYKTLIGSKIYEEIHTAKDLRLDIRGKVMKIGNKEIYLVSEEPVLGIFRGTGELYISRMVEKS